MIHAVKTSGIAKQYGHITALSNVTLHVEQGEIFGFLGPNGAGKSTFVKILLNLISYDTGTALLFGHDARTHRSRRSVGFLPESIRPYHFATVKEALYYHAVLADIPPKDKKSAVKRALSITGMTEYSFTKMRNLSKGLLQRAGLAIALIGNPRLIIMDEPTSGLDPVGIRDVRTLILNLKKEGVTVFLNSHHLSEVEKTCDRIAILHKGSIIKTGTKHELSEDDQHLEITVSSFTPDMQERIVPMCTRPIERDDNVLHLYLSNRNDTEKVLSAIHDSGGQVRSFAWKDETLEDVFYRLVK